MPQPIKAYLGTTPIFTASGTSQGFAFIEGTDAGGGVQSLNNEFKHNTGTVTIFGNVTSTKDFHLCEGSAAVPANCIITGTITQTNSGPQGGPRGFTVTQSANQVGTLTINGANISLFGGMFIGDNGATNSVGAVVMNSGTLNGNGEFYMAGANNTLTQNGGTASHYRLWISGGGNATSNPSLVSVVNINGGIFDVKLPVALSQSLIMFGSSTAGVSSINTLNLNGGTLKYNGITSNPPASGRTQVNTINFNGGTLDFDKGTGRALPMVTGVAGLTWNLVIKNGGAIISVLSGQTMTMAVAFSNDGTNGGLIKQGAGTLDLGSLAHSYNGATSISAGTITVAKTNGSSTGTATFTPTTLSVSFNIAPTAGMTFKFFPGATTQTYASVALTGAPGRTGSYNSANSTLTIS